MRAYPLFPNRQEEITFVVHLLWPPPLTDYLQPFVHAELYLTMASASHKDPLLFT